MVPSNDSLADGYSCRSGSRATGNLANSLIGCGSGQRAHLGTRGGRQVGGQLAIDADRVVAEVGQAGGFAADGARPIGLAVGETVILPTPLAYPY